MIAQNDPLRDQSMLFALRLKKIGIDVTLKEYGLLPHGFLNYNSNLLGFKEESTETIM